jgi:hypothetical protein
MPGGLSTADDRRTAIGIGLPTGAVGPNCARSAQNTITWESAPLKYDEVRAAGRDRELPYDVMP